MNKNQALLLLIPITFTMLGGCLEGQMEPPGEFDSDDADFPPNSNGPHANVDDAVIDCDESGITLQPSHGSATLTLPSCARITELTVTQVGHPVERRYVITSTNRTNDSFTVPFLEPSSRYIVETRGELNGTGIVESFSFQTLSHPEHAPLESAAIHPGMNFRGSPITTGGCTLAFIARDATNESLYALTAGHCVEHGVGEERYFPYEDTPFATVVYAINEWDLDVGVLKIHDEFVSEVNPTIPLLGGPTLVAPSEIHQSEIVCFMGQAYLFAYGLDGQTIPRQRCGSFSSYRTDYEGLMFASVASQGDSGSPVILGETGEALGILVAGLGPLQIAVPICHALEHIEDAIGLELQILTAPSNSALSEVSTSVPNTNPYPFEEKGEPECREETILRHVWNVNS